jgi:hypothetical protein
MGVVSIFRAASAARRLQASGHKPGDWLFELTTTRQITANQTRLRREPTETLSSYA